MPVATVSPEKPATKRAAPTPIGAGPFLLALPAFITLIVACVRAWSRGLVPTGFVQYDVPYYVANARQYFAGGFHLTYSNPYAPYGSPTIYFQPHLLLLGLLDRLGFDPGISYTLFGLPTAAFAAWASPVYYIARRESSWKAPDGARRVHSNSKFVIWEVPEP